MRRTFVALRIALATAVGVGLLGVASVPPPDFSYDRGASLALRVQSRSVQGQIETQAITFVSAQRRIGATLVRRHDGRRHAGVLFVHWLGDPQTTNRSEFLPDARLLAAHGVTSLVVDAMWAEPDWFDRRTTAGDYDASLAQVVALRRALDVLTGQADVDPHRLAFVGHDFGAMYGALLAGTDARPQAYVFMTPTVTFWEWYLLGVRPADKYAYIARMRALDTPPALARARFRAALVQFAKHDEYVPGAAAREFASAVHAHDRTVTTYDADHALHVAPARNDRIAWLLARLRQY